MYLIEKNCSKNWIANVDCRAAGIVPKYVQSTQVNNGEISRLILNELIY